MAPEHPASPACTHSRMPAREYGAEPLVESEPCWRELPDREFTPQMDVERRRTLTHGWDRAVERSLKWIEP